MAEIMVLLLFILLLVLTTALAKTSDSLEAEVERSSLLQKERNAAKEELSKILAILPEKEGDPDSPTAVEKLTLCQKSEAELAQRLKEAEAIVLVVKQAQSEASPAFEKMDPEELKEKIRQAILLHGSIEPRLLEEDEEKKAAAVDPIKSLAKAINELPNDYWRDETAARDEPSNLEQCKTNLETLKDQFANLEERHRAGGKGTDHPACWVNPVTKRTEYIFGVRMTRTGFTVHDRKLPHRIKDQAGLPLSAIVWDQEVGDERFLRMMDELLKWSKDQEPECRFFVQISDETKDLDISKSKMRVLEQIFYKFEPQKE